MKKALIIFIIAFLGVCNLGLSQAPDWLWAKGAGGSSYEYGSTVATDDSGNVYMAGYFMSPTLTFGTTTLTNNGATDIFLVKYDTDGNVIWAKSAGGSDLDRSYSVATDGNGNVYLTGLFYSPSIMFGSITLTNPIAQSNSVYLVKYDSNGNVIWANSTNSNSISDQIYEGRVATDPNGNIFLTGYYTCSNLTFGTTTIYNTGVSTNDCYLVKYDSLGNVLWAKSEGGADYEDALGIDVDAFGNVYITGIFNSANFPIGSDTLVNIGLYDTFIAKYDSNGIPLWAKSGGSSDDDFCWGLSTDVNGNAFISGNYNGASISFGTLSLVNTIGSAGALFIVKYDSNGNELWANTAGGLFGEMTNCVTTDTSGNAIITGFFSSPTITFGTTTLTRTGNVNLFLAKYDAAGNVLWANSPSGNSYDEGLGVAADVSGNIYVSGKYTSTSMNFGSTTIINNSPAIFDTFIAKLEKTNVGVEEIENQSDFLIAPNPFTTETILTFNEFQKKITIKILDILGKEIFASTFSGKQLIIEKNTMKPGIYFIQTIDENKNTSNKKIILQ